MIKQKVCSELESTRYYIKLTRLNDLPRITDSVLSYSVHLASHIQNSRRCIPDRASIRARDIMRYESIAKRCLK